jgi:spermidine/putrescine transport system substrate-binding protein
MIDNQYETIGAALKYLGYSYTSDNESELMKARDVLLKQKPYIMAYDSWPRRLLVEEEAWMAHLWVGDGWLLSKDVPTMQGVMPPPILFRSSPPTASARKAAKIPALPLEFW